MSAAASQRSSNKQYKMAAKGTAISNAPENNSPEQYVEYDIEEKPQVSIDGDDQTEATEQFFNWSQICRVCANTNDHIIPIFEAEGAEHDLINKIHKYLPIQVSKTDTLPLQLCYHCAATILAWHELLEGCLDAEKQLLEMQVQQSEKQQLETKFSENLNEEQIDDPEQAVMEQQEEDPTEHASIGEKPTKRSREEIHAPTMPTTSANDEENETMVYENETESVVCEKCESSFCKISELVEHMRNVHDDRVHHCHYCDSIFRASEAAFREHVKSHETGTRNNNESDDSENNFPDYRYEINVPSDISRAEEIYEGSDPLRLEGESSESLEESALIERTSLDTGHSVEYRCEFCDVFMPISREDFLQHVQSHLRKCTRLVESVEIRERKTTNQLCINQRSYMCEYCGKTYSSLINLREHQKVVHRNLNLHMCDLCERNFTSASKLVNHRRIHTKERTNACEYCGKSFRTANAMQTHMLNHDGENRNVCDMCGKKYSTKSQLIEHKNEHEQNLTFVCETCGKNFHAKRNLLRHFRVHSADKTFVCKHCPSKFRQKRYLRVHTTIHHPDEVLEIV